MRNPALHLERRPKIVVVDSLDERLAGRIAAALAPNERLVRLRLAMDFDLSQVRPTVVVIDIDRTTARPNGGVTDLLSLIDRDIPLVVVVTATSVERAEEIGYSGQGLLRCSAERTLRWTASASIDERRAAWRRGGICARRAYASAAPRSCRHLECKPRIWVCGEQCERVRHANRSRSQYTPASVAARRRLRAFTERHH